MKVVIRYMQKSIRIPKLIKINLFVFEKGENFICYRSESNSLVT